MNEDQIKAIAEEYVKHTTAQQYVWRFHPDTDIKIAMQAEALQLLKYLSTRYCVVEREKVIDYYKQSHTECFMPTTCLDREFARGKCRVMEDLFGTSMFKQNKE